MDTPQLKLLNQAMNAYSRRLQAVATNIANLDTPGYQRLSVSFEEQLQEARHTVGGPERLSEVSARMDVEDGPAVLEDELMELADTQMRTQMTSRALRDHFERLRTAVIGRSG